MNIVFAGTPEFAGVALDALIGAGHVLSLVLTQPDRPAGRGHKPRPSAVKLLAEKRRLPVLQPSSLKDERVAAAIAAHQPDVMVVAAYGLIVPGAVLDLPRLGCLNIHASLLPRWRGAAPIQRALLAGDATTGITIMQMNEGLDTGAILLQEAIPISDTDTAQTLHDRLAVLGGGLIVRALAAPFVPRPQDETLATYARKIDKQEAHIDWTESAASVERRIRAFNPAPGAYALLDGETLKIWRADVERGVSATPGEIVESSAAALIVACGADALRLIEIQRAGGKRVPARAFLAGRGLARGARLG